eukprot:m.317542 g.317542  ORF g.317542 m.317542 type:complete len:412 (-) comp16435_c0_seq4:616-1851(-)
MQLPRAEPHRHQRALRVLARVVEVAVPSRARGASFALAPLATLRIGGEEKCRHVPSIVHFAFVQRVPRQRSERGHPIKRRGELLHDGTGCDNPRPPHQRRHTDSALPESPLSAPQVSVDPAEDAPVQRAPVVRRHDRQRLLRNVELVQEGVEPADRPIQQRERIPKEPALCGAVGEALVITLRVPDALAGRELRGVGVMTRKVEEERHLVKDGRPDKTLEGVIVELVHVHHIHSVGISWVDSRRLPGGDIARAVEPRARAERSAFLGRPGSNQIGVAFVLGHGGAVVDIKAVVRRVVLPRPQVPLPRHPCAVAHGLELGCDGGLVEKEPAVRVGRENPRVHPNADKVPPGHEGPAGGRADRGSRVVLRQLGTIRRHLVEGRGDRGWVSEAPKVPVANVVAKEQHAAAGGRA